MRNADASNSDDVIRTAIAAASDTRVVAELEAIYASVATEIAGRGPACWASGRCCNFRKVGHDLFVTLLEAAYCVRRDAEARKPAAASKDVSLPQMLQRSELTMQAVDTARERGDCPYLDGNLCGAHEMKPLGCRVYFCDASAQEWQHELTERALRDIRALHDRFNVPYVYDEWWRQLSRCVSPAH